MTPPSMSSEINGLLALLRVARTSAAVGEAIGCEEALVDAYNRISKLLRDMEMHEHRQRSERGALGAAARALRITRAFFRSPRRERLGTRREAPRNPPGFFIWGASNLRVPANI